MRLSRNTPTEILGTSVASSLRARTDAANSWGADFFISIHANASTIESASGSEGFAYSASSRGYPMGEDILFWLNRATGLENRGMSVRPTLWVLRKSAMPGGAYRTWVHNKRIRCGAYVGRPRCLCDRDLHRHTGILRLPVTLRAPQRRIYRKTVFCCFRSFSPPLFFP